MSDPRIHDLTNTQLTEALHLASSAYNLHLGACALCRAEHACTRAAHLAAEVADLASESIDRTEATWPAAWPGTQHAEPATIRLPLGHPDAVPSYRPALRSYTRPGIPLNDYACLRDADLAFAYTLAATAYQWHAHACPQCQELRTIIGGGICAEALTLLAPVAAIEAEQAHRAGQAEATQL